MMAWPPERGSLDLVTLRRLYGEGALKPSDVIAAAYERIARRGDDSFGTYLAPREATLAALVQMHFEMMREMPGELPLPRH